MERSRDLPLIDVLVLQRAACERAGSALYARILDAMVDDVHADGPCAAILRPWADNAMADAIPLRFLAAVHALVLTDEAPALAAHYASAGGTDTGDPMPAFLATVEAHRTRIEAAMDLGVQTNEVGRATSLFGGFHAVARRTGLPLRQLEVGASAGLLLHWDRYGYRAGGGVLAWGPGDGLVFEDPWTADLPPVAAELVVAERRGCDQAPIDPTTDEGAIRLRSFLWPDQVERRARLDAAIEVARRHPVVVDAMDAADWIEAQLAEPTPGLATVVHHSIVLQYLPRSSFVRVRAAIEQAGERATPDAPIHWLRMEPAGDVADVRMSSWPGRDGGHDEELLATTGYHGPPVTWLGGP
ncbi:DUF2332 domain-containing protein [Acidimicrobiia bacterium EGI L10123]|uniref:DUF2332 domain-containing protein n=1 Tax=Salinilacustrithrix flava TaxID=2957203 RepID=UPI003D7C363D|nr:DUF2332 domain-containing protein [Acidimicrobiia bacterium EGI L10123]